MTAPSGASGAPPPGIPWRQRLLTRTVVFLIVPALLPLLLASGAVLYFIGAEARREAEAALLASVADARSRAAYYFEALEGDIRFVASHITGDDSRSPENVLLAIAFATTSRHDIETLWIQPRTGPVGVLYSRREMLDRTGRPPLDRAAVESTRDVAWYATERDEFGEPILTGSAPLRHPWEERARGWLIFTIRPDFLQSLPAGIEIGRTGRALLVDDSGRLVADRRGPGARDEEVSRSLAAVQRLREAGRTDPLPRTALAGANLAGWGTISPIRWGIVILRGESDIYGPRNRMALLVVGACVALVLMILPLVLTFSLRVTRPITSLLVAIEKFGAGELVSLDGVHSRGELGALARAFQRMREQRLLGERRYREIVDSTDNLITNVDPQGRFVFVNRVSQRLFGLEPSAMVGRLAFDFVHPDDRGRTEAWFARCVEDRIQQATIENRQIFGDAGRVSHLLWNCHLRYDGEGRFTGMTSIAHDVTGRREAEEERKRLDARLAQSQRLESIGTLAGGVAHDFNNILGAIVGYGCELRAKMQPDDPLRLYAGEILSAAERGAAVTQGLLAFSRKQIFAPRHVDLGASVGRVGDFLSRIIGETVTLRIRAGDTPLTVFADPNQLDQILMNLASNARDAMPAGGVLTIGTERADGDAVPGAAPGAAPHGMLTVSDTGTGMDEGTRAKIFEPFFTTKQPGRGTGLGLAIVYGIVKQNHGFISVYSEPGRGTTFKIYFPLVAAAPEARPAEPVAEATHRGTETILLAEDDRAIRTLYGKVLSEHGYAVIEAEDGEAALRAFEENADAIQLVITDVVMPRRSGRELSQAVQARKPGVRVIFTSGYPADFVEETGALDEGIHFLSKPTTPRSLLQTVRDVLDGSNGAGDPPRNPDGPARSTR